mmetsp:Transcript_27860/g.62167  ORF Transcript_27860/g.62167 Transcript_27860/m.62167 type:complete len:265 (-) Transcript_27860:489-1283(-)
MVDPHPTGFKHVPDSLDVLNHIGGGVDEEAGGYQVEMRPESPRAVQARKIAVEERDAAQDLGAVGGEVVGDAGEAEARRAVRPVRVVQVHVRRHLQAAAANRALRRALQMLGPSAQDAVRNGQHPEANVVPVDFQAGEPRRDLPGEPAGPAARHEHCARLARALAGPECLEDGAVQLFPAAGAERSPVPHQVGKHLCRVIVRDRVHCDRSPDPSTSVTPARWLVAGILGDPRLHQDEVPTLAGWRSRPMLKQVDSDGGRPARQV